MQAWTIAPALSVGNTVVLKPAQFTSLTALLFAELAAQAGVPAGVLNVVTGDGATGAPLVDPGVDKIAFTGSTELGRWLQPTSTRSSRHPTSRQGSSTSLPAEAIAS
jgi:aldehyde dehydrogenase (NAD+)